MVLPKFSSSTLLEHGNESSENQDNACVVDISNGEHMICLDCRNKIHAIFPNKIACIGEKPGLIYGPEKGGAYQGTLRTFCPDGHAYLPLTPGGACVACTNPNCARCRTDNLNVCIGCRENFRLDGTTCVNTVCQPNEYLSHSEGNRCLLFTLPGCIKGDGFGGCSKEAHPNGGCLNAGETHSSGVCCTQTQMNRDTSVFPGKCLKCHAFCGSNCTGIGSSQCSDCAPFSGRRLNGGTCQPCTALTLRNKCMSCDSAPATCTSSLELVSCGIDKCSSCSSFGGCSSCLTGYYREGTSPTVIAVCSKCSVGCTSCGPDSCDACSGGVTISGLQCNCPAGQFLNDTVQPTTCQLTPRCPENCTTCSINDTCILCKPNFKLTSGVCTCESAAGFKLINNYTCSPCNPGCTMCSNLGPGCTGTVCLAGYLNFPDCQCPAGQIPQSSLISGVQHVCGLPCIAIVNCISCISNPNICEGCGEKFLLETNSCVCPMESGGIVTLSPSQTTCACEAIGFGLNLATYPISCERCAVLYCDDCKSNKAQCEVSGCKPSFIRASVNECKCPPGQGINLSVTPVVCEACAVLYCDNCSSNKAQCEVSGCKATFSRTTAGLCECPTLGFYQHTVSSQPVCSQCHSSCVSCQGPLDTECLSCPQDKVLSPAPLGACITACQCRDSNDVCQTSCPETFVPSSNPSEFLQNAALTFLIEQQSFSAQSSNRVYRLKFSDPPIQLRVPLSFNDLSSVLKIEIEGHQQRTNYDQTLTYNTSGFIDIKIAMTTAISSTTLKATFIDSTKVIGHNGKRLENGQTEIQFSGFSNMLSAIISQDTLKSAAAVTSATGATAVAASTGAMSIMTIFGVALGAVGKFFQVVEFTGLLAFFNIQFDEVIDAFLTFTESIGDFDIFDFPFEKTMQENIQNSVAMKWRGKFSILEQPSWHLMKIGWTGIYMALVYAIHLALVLLGSTSKWRGRLSLLKTNLAQSYIMDHLAIGMTTLSNGSLYHMDTWGRKLSYLTSIIFISIFTYELMNQYFENERLCKIKEENLTPVEKGLSELYFDGLCEEELQTSWYVRNYNLLFTLRLLFISFIIVTMQYLQILQVLLSIVVMLLFLILTIINSRKYRIFVSKMVKVFRIIQDSSYTVLMMIVGVFYFYQKKGGLDEKIKNVLIIAFGALVLTNIVLEIIILASDLISKCKCCKKKKVPEEKAVEASDVPLVIRRENNPRIEKNHEGVSRLAPNTPRVRVEVKAQTLKRLQERINQARKEAIQNKEPDEEKPKLKLKKKTDKKNVMKQEKPSLDPELQQMLSPHQTPSAGVRITRKKGQKVLQSSKLSKFLNVDKQIRNQNGAIFSSFFGKFGKVGKLKNQGEKKKEIKKFEK